MPSKEPPPHQEPVEERANTEVCDHQGKHGQHNHSHKHRANSGRAKLPSYCPDKEKRRSHTTGETARDGVGAQVWSIEEGPQNPLVPKVYGMQGEESGPITKKGQEQGKWHRLGQECQHDQSSADRRLESLGEVDTALRLVR